MKDQDKNVEMLEPVDVKPFHVEQLTGGLEMTDMDNTLLGYLNFISNQIPIKSANFLHVVPQLEFLQLLLEGEKQPIAGELILNENIKKDMTRLINQTLSKEKEHGIEEIKFNVREGNALEELLKEADTSSSDLLLIGQRSHAGSHGILAKKLARKVNCNALIVPEKAAHKLKRILVPIDFSSNSAKALQTAVSIQKSMTEPAEIVCLNVYEVPNLSSYNTGRTVEQFVDSIEKHWNTFFTSFIQENASDETIEQVLIQKEMPKTSRYIMNYANEHDIDFIIIGAKGHSKLALLLLGSVTESLLNQNKTIPTLVVK